MNSAETKRGRARTCGKALLTLLIAACFCAGLFSIALAQGETTLIVGLLGVAPSDPDTWLSLPLTGRFDVTVNGAAAGRVTANPTAEQKRAGETDTLTLPGGATEAVLTPVAEDFVNGYDCQEPVTVSVTAGKANTRTVFAYAERGFFRVENTMRDGTAAAGGAEFVALDADGVEQWSFATDENGEYRALRPLPDGDYTLTQTKAPQGAALLTEPVAFTVGTYFGKAEDVVSVPVVNEPATAGGATAASVTGTIRELGAGANVAIASVTLQRSATTASDGSFAFAGLPSGDYTVYAPLPEGKTPAEDSPWRLSDKGDMIWMTVSVPDGETYTLPAVEFITLGTVSGVAYVDADGDGAYTQGERAVASVPVALLALNNGEWTQVAEGATGEDGRYAFTGLAAGTYRVQAAAAGGLSVVSAGGELTLADGETATGLSDVAMGTSAAVKVSAFFDSNENGVRGVYERSIAGVTAEAVPASDPQGAAAASAVTDANGEAVLTGFAPGAYVLRFTLPDGYLYTTATGRWDAQDSCVGGTDSLTAVSAPLTLASGETAEAGVGAVPVGSFSGKVWNDQNNDGVLDADEAGVANVALTLTGTKTGSVYRFTTDDTGEYRFSLLRNDTYAFTAELPEGLLFARYTKTGGNARSVFTTEETSATREFPVLDAQNVTDMNVGVIRPATLTGIAFLDTNYNGVMDEGEPPYANVTLEVVKNSNDKSMGKVVTGQDGRYAFSSLRGGDYRLRAVLPDDGSIFTVVPAAGAEGLANLFAAREGRRENTIASITLENGASAETCVGVAMGGTITGTVFMDKGYDGVRDGKDATSSGVSIQLVGEDGTPAATTASAANGRYKITGIMPGNYTVRFQRKDGYAFTRYRPNEENGNDVEALAKDGFGETAPVAVAMGQTIDGIDAGMLPSSTLSGVFFDDLNDNGLRDEGEGGYTDGSVRLLSTDGEIDLTEPVGEDGAYFFDGVMPGEYTVTFLLPENAAMARVTSGGNTLEAQGRENVMTGLTVESGAAYEAPLVGAVTLGTFTGYAYHDANGNGVKDEGEQAMAGVTVTLTPGQSSLVASEAVTDTDGAFSVTGLRPGSYTLALELPEGYIFSGNLAASGLTLDTARTDTLACPWTALTNRAQNAVGAVLPATVTASVWLDENRDGARAAGERTLPGLTFSLYDEAEEQTVKTARSGDNGVATFAGVRPGTYSVRFDLPEQAQPANAPGDFAASGNTMRTAAFTVAEGSDSDTLTAGLVSYTSVGGTVALDENGARTGLAGVKVALYEGADNEPAQTAATDDAGRYRFDGLWPDTYRLTVELPNGMIFVRPNDPNYDAGSSAVTDAADGVGTSDPFPLEMAKHLLSMNVILIKPARVGDQAWLDTNQNGLMDAGEPAVNGVSIQLMENGEIAYTTVTNEWGYFEFGDVYPGTYTLKAQAYPELDVTKSVAALRVISSCLTSGDGANAESDPFSVESGTRNLNFDLGYVLKDGAKMPEAIAPGGTQRWPAASGE